MTGLDKMIQQILDEANRKAEAILAKSQAEAASIHEQAEKDCQILCEEMTNQATQEQKNLLERAESSGQLKKRQAILRAKQEIINNMIDKAYASALKMDDTDYFVMLTKMLEHYVLPEEGELYFNTADLKRMPKDFTETIQKIASDKGGSLKLAKQDKPIDGGFILVYGGIEENCSFKALFDDKKDALSDKVNRMLFA